MITEIKEIETMMTDAENLQNMKERMENDFATALKEF